MNKKSRETIGKLLKNDQLDVFDVCNWFIRKSEKDDIRITHKKLQKLLYYAKHWSLWEDKDNDVKLPEGLSINAGFEAWVHGAVCRRVFLEYRIYGFDDLRNKASKE